MKRGLICFSESIAVRLAVVEAKIAYEEPRVPSKYQHAIIPSVTLGVACVFGLPSGVVTVPLGLLSSLIYSMYIDERHDNFRDLLIERAELVAKIKEAKD